MAHISRTPYVSSIFAPSCPNSYTFPLFSHNSYLSNKLLTPNSPHVIYLYVDTWICVLIIFPMFSHIRTFRHIIHQIQPILPLFHPVNTLPHIFIVEEDSLILSKREKFVRHGIGISLYVWEIACQNLPNREC